MLELFNKNGLKIYLFILDIMNKHYDIYAYFFIQEKKKIKKKKTFVYILIINQFFFYFLYIYINQTI